MLKEIQINNYKSILEDKIELGRVNVFIGANGSGKSNIIEAIAMLSAAKNNDLDPEGLINRGVRVAPPMLTFSSFLGKKIKESINIKYQYYAKIGEGLEDEYTEKGSVLLEPKGNEIFSEWNENTRDNVKGIDPDKQIKIYSKVAQIYTKMSEFISLNKDGNLGFEKYEKVDEYLKNIFDDDKDVYDIFYKYNNVFVKNIMENKRLLTIQEVVGDYVIFNLNTQALRGVSIESHKTPLGIYGEGLDVLLANLNTDEMSELLNYQYLISWLDKFVLNTDDSLKYAGYKLGRSKSNLYFIDKYMRRNNNLFSAENSNEGALHILFYLTLFISNKTPKVFAIDNIETALNPMLCRELMKSLANLSKSHNKQALITTHNPAVLDGLNLHDNDQRLFEVYRNEDGHTKTRRIKTKKDVDGTKLKLSEMWMRGHLGARPDEF